MPEPTPSATASTDQTAASRPDPIRPPAPSRGRWFLRLTLVALILVSTTGVALNERQAGGEVPDAAPDRLLFGPELAALDQTMDVPVQPRPPRGLIDGLWIDTADRDAVVDAYVDAFERTTPELIWTGTHRDCEPGDSPDELRRATLERVVYYRAMAGVPASVIEDPEHSRLAQAAALMMSAEGSLTHHPEADFACFSLDGRLAAANSNLYLGRTGPEAIDGYIEDPGERNLDVGHRSTILHPPTRAMGVGHVAGDDDRHAANVLWVFDDRVFAGDVSTREPDGFVAWPPRGFVPASVVYPRWSLALAEADVDNARVTMEVDGRSINPHVVTRQSKIDEVPSSIVVWEPDSTMMSRLVHNPLANGIVDEVKISVTVHDVALPDDGTRPSSSAAGHDFTYDVFVIPAPALDDSPLDRVLDPIARAAFSALDMTVPTAGP